MPKRKKKPRRTAREKEDFDKVLRVCQAAQFIGFALDIGLETEQIVEAVTKLPEADQLAVAHVLGIKSL